MPLRNFPHQINQLEKLHASLAACADLLEDGANPLDDGELGYACARAGVYAFRGLVEPSAAEIERRIATEQRKKTSDQGPRTFARDLRRTLYLMGLLEIHDDTASISPIGQRLLQFDAGSADAEYITLWREAILRITLAPTATHPNALRPAPVILKIVQEFPDIEKRWLALAFEAGDESDAEYRRIRAMIVADDFERAMRDIGASEFQAANAVKIIPALLEQVGLIHIDGSRCGITAEGEGIRAGRTRTVVSRRGAARRRRRAGSLEANVTRPEDIIIPPAAGGRREPDREAMIAALAALEARTREHQELLRKLDMRQTRDRFDLFAKSSVRNEGLLFEVKAGENFLLQGRLALGQLCLYEHFDVRPGLGQEPRILKVAVFDGEPGQDVREFLAAYEVHCLAFVAGTFVVPQDLADYLGLAA
jgi:hypothetical protein